MVEREGWCGVNEITIRRFNQSGLAKVQEFLDTFKDDPARSVDLAADILPLLIDPALTIATPVEITADAEKVFARRYDLAEYLYGIVPRLGLPDPARDKGLWVWFSMLWFEQLAPVEKGRRKVGERAKWIPDGAWKYYRHLVQGAYLLYQINSDRPQRAMALLFNPPHTPGELVGQLAAKQAVVQSRAAVGAATLLYFDESKGMLKRGSRGRTGKDNPNALGGTPERFNLVLEQLDRTYDLHSLHERDLVKLLPREFDRFKKDAPNMATTPARSRVRDRVRRILRP